MTDRSAAQGTGADAAQAAGAKGPDELRRQIEQTRRQLGDTVEELAARVDIKGRARARAADLRDKAGAMTVQLRSSAAQAGHTVHHRALRAGHTVQGRATHAGELVGQRAPRPVGDAVRSGLRGPRPVLIAAAVVGLVVVAGAIRRHGGRWQ
ncbi:DUF3618 domain-containing protein [Streptomyces sp. NPDC005574]|uniref:DUF3618 domain-containing protein n=1 Tax=Streptomyces sp. NPDC005574 TaxID=3156891 RepID=UPI0033AE8F69